MIKQVVIYSFLLLSITSCAQSGKKVNAATFEKQVAEAGTQLLDVRTMQEYNRGHIKGAMQANWNNSAEFAERTAHLSKEKPVYVYCQAGGRSEAAASWLSAKGFRVIDLSGGMIGWQKENKPVEGATATTEYTLADFKSMINDSTKTYLVDIGAAWCPPCVKMKPVVDELVKEKATAFTFVNIDAGVHINLQKELNVEALPTFIIYKNGIELKRIQGITTKEALANALNGK
jgi:rhodanese-related sulfurtransferase